MIREARRRKAHLGPLDESGFMLAPAVRRALAPRGQAPIIKGPGRHDRISAISAVTVSPKRRRLGSPFHLMPDDEDVHGEDAVEFLERLRRHIPGPMTTLWGRGNVHARSKVARSYLAGRPDIVTEKSPGYAPETNPDEMVWPHTKHARLSSLTPEDVAELRATAVAELERLHGGPELLAPFTRHAKVPIRLRMSSH